MLYRCPLCYQPLSLKINTYTCPNKHAFDIAKEGYVNLLPVQSKRSKDPGDNADMVKARRDFLNQDYYLPLREQIHLRLNLGAEDNLLDIGCGEGWYSGPLAKVTQVYGIDISKSAIRLAAKEYHLAHFAVANSLALPFQDGCFSHALNVFAPIDLIELKRVLKPNGCFIQVTPAEYHLFEIKQILYHQARLHLATEIILPGFEHLKSMRLQHRFEINEFRDLKNLIQMTPYVWQAEKRGDQILKASLPLSCQIDVWIHRYQKT